MKDRKQIPISKKVDTSKLEGKYVNDLSKDLRIWIDSRTFSVSYLPITNEDIIKDNLDRIFKGVKNYDNRI